MSFLDDFDEPYRSRFQAAGSLLEIARGEHLLRRGEPGGDVYLVQTGELEVVDTRTTPEVILSTLGPGTVVGEMAFVDNAPRSADVRASSDVVVTRWARDDLRTLFDRQPRLAATFFECVARLAARRMRRLTQDALVGAIRGGPRSQVNTPGQERVRSEALHIAERTKTGLLHAEDALARQPEDDAALLALNRVLERLQSDMAELVHAHSSVVELEAATQLLGRELHPYLIRSGLAARCIRRRQGVSGTAEILAHVLVNQPSGDGRLGEHLDRWLLSRPTNRALRALRRPTLQLLEESLPRHRNRRVLVVNAGTGSLVAEILQTLSHPPTRVTVIDQSREALAFLDAGTSGRPRGVDLVTHQENLARFAMGSRNRQLPRQDAIILHGLLEYLPDRLASSLLEVARDLLQPSGTVIATALASSPDEPMFSWLLGWPTVRRSPGAMRRIIRAAKLDTSAEPVLDRPALLSTAQRVDDS